MKADDKFNLVPQIEIIPLNIQHAQNSATCNFVFCILGPIKRRNNSDFHDFNMTVYVIINIIVNSTLLDNEKRKRTSDSYESMHSTPRERKVEQETDTRMERHSILTR